MFLVYSATNAVVLPSEELGNTEQLQKKLVTQRTLDGSQTTYARSSTNVKKEYSFKRVKPSAYQPLIELILESKATPIHFEDSRGTSTIGVLLSDGLTLTSEHESDGLIFRDFKLTIVGS